MEQTHYVYHICRKGQEEELTHGYIGVTVEPDRRWEQHVRCAFYQKKHQKIYCYMRKFEKELSFRVIFEGTFEEAYDKEAELRPEQGIGWNIARGGDNTHNMFGIHCTVNGTTYPSIKLAAKHEGLDYATIKKMIKGEEVFVTKLRDRKIPPSNLKPVTIVCQVTGEEHSFNCMTAAWEWIGKTGPVNGNIAKQTKKGRAAYGYFWKY